MTEFKKLLLGGCSGRMLTTPNGYAGDGFMADVDTKENAQRLAACWNACTGIHTEALEGQELLDILQKCQDIIRNWYLHPSDDIDSFLVWELNPLVTKLEGSTNAKP